MSIVRDYMNRSLVYIREGDVKGIALRPILDVGITAVPVLDEDDVPVDVVSLRDLVGQGPPLARPPRGCPTRAESWRSPT